MGIVSRGRYASKRVLGAFADAQDFRSKIYTARCVAGWVRLKVGLAAKSSENTIQLRDLRLRVDTSRAELVPYWEVWQEHAYESVPGFSFTNAKCIVDVGANIGVFSLYQALKKAANLIVAFEPSPACFQRLKTNIEINSASNIQAINAAVGSCCGTLPFLELPFSFNSRVANNEEYGTVTVPAVTLDAALKSFSQMRIDLLKIDTEGFEIPVLQGAIETLERTDRVILERHKGSSREEFDSLLGPRGLAFVGAARELLFYSR